MKHMERGQQTKLNRGINNEFNNRNDVLQKNVETEEWNQWMQQWGMGKSRNKVEMKRRSEQQRMLTQKIGVTKIEKKKTEQPVTKEV